MMDDRFAAQLRQQLLDTANERPARDTLAAILDGVAVTTEHHGVAARLTWFPRRMSVFPSAAVRYGLIAAVLIALVAAGCSSAGVQGSGRSSRGPDIDRQPGWQHAVPDRGAGPSPSVHFEDRFATGAACRSDADKVFTADGTGQITGGRLDATFPDGGGCGSVTVEVALRYVYDASTDSLRDQDDLRWHRVEGGDAPATPAPTTEPSPYTMPSPLSSAPPTPHPGESTYTSTIHSYSVGVPFGWQTRPATEPWGGEPLDFSSPAADVIFDPSLGDRLYLLVASRSFSGMSEAGSGEVLDWTCPEGRGEFWGWRVDGVYSFQRGPATAVRSSQRTPAAT
jgi:hypothetical protein